MTLEEEDRLIEMALEARIYSDFRTVSEEFRTEKFAEKWLKVMAKSGRAPLREYFRQIPLNLVNDRMRAMTVTANPKAIEHIQPADTEIYERLCRIAIHKDVEAAHLVHESVRTTEFLSTLCVLSDAFMALLKSCEWVRNAMTPELKVREAGTNPLYMLAVEDEFVSDQALCRHFSKHLRNLKETRERGKLHLFARFLKNGGWPLSALQMERPRTAADAVKAIEKHSYDYQTLYMGVAMTFPIEDVLPLLNTQKLVGLAQEMYPKAELRQHMKLNRIVRVIFLEDELGL